MSQDKELIDPRRLLVKIAEVLHRLKIPYIVTGGMAIFVWGRPRFTADVDIVIKLDSKSLDSLAKALKELSKEISYVDEKMMRRALERKGEFNFIDGDSGIKVDFWVSGDDEFSRKQLQRRVEKKVLRQEVSFISPEDLILSKLIWYKKSESSRQIEDIESILKIQNKLDMKYIKKWAKIHSTSKILEKLVKEI